MFLAGAGAGSVESRGGLDVEVCGGAEGLAQHRSGVPMMNRRTFLGTAAGAGAAWGQEKTAGGNGTFYIGARPNRILIFDEATERVTGEIGTKTGSPGWMHLSEDKTRIYTGTSTLEDIEIVDVASRRVIDTIRLSEGNKKVRLRGGEADPSHRYVLMMTRAATKHVDRWEISPAALVQYDLAQRKVVRTIPWPKGEEREFVRLRFSPDGKHVFLFGDDIVVYETKEFKEVDQWELSRPIEDGFGRISLGWQDDTYEEPGYTTGLFTVQDAVQNRRIMGIARVNLERKSVEFYALGPATSVSFAMAPDRELAYGLHQEIGRYEFWTFDLKNRRVRSRTEFGGRPRMSLMPSTNGKLLYIYQAGSTIDVYEAATYKYLRTVDVGADMTGLVVIPGRA
jgi:hypothetical protein